MFEYNGRSYNEGSDYSRVILKGFFNHFEKTEDAMFYLIKGLEMIHHELYKEYVKESESDKDTYAGKHYEKQYQCGKLSQAIEALEVE